MGIATIVFTVVGIIVAIIVGGGHTDTIAK